MMCSIETMMAGHTGQEWRICWRAALPAGWGKTYMECGMSRWRNDIKNGEDGSRQVFHYSFSCLDISYLLWWQGWASVAAIRQFSYNITVCMSARCKTGFLTLRKRLFGTAEQAFWEHGTAFSANPESTFGQPLRVLWRRRWSIFPIPKVWRHGSGNSRLYVIKACLWYINDGVSPVETQNLASPVQQTHQWQAYNRLYILRILACETQDFASLLLQISV